MNPLHFFLFFSVFLSIYGGANFYIFLRGWQALPRIPYLRLVYTLLFLYLALSYIIGRVTERFSVCSFSTFCIWTGSFWMAAMIYILLMLVALDLFRFANRLFPYFPSSMTQNYQNVKLVALLLVLLISSVTVAVGYRKARSPVVKRLEIPVRGKKSKLKELRIAMASDIHLGNIIKNSRLNRLVKIINDEKPDIVLFAGDIIDEDLKPVVENNLGDSLLQIRAPYGIYCVNGNHEFIGGVEAADRYLNAHNLRVLRDQWALVDDSFYVVGREDLSSGRFGGGKRKELKEVMAPLDRTKPVILLDHQPFGLEESVQEGVDLQLSGHTHKGQLWPFNYITQLIFEVPSGYKKIKNTSIYVSSGYGTWGPPVRVGSDSEVVMIRLLFKE